jgi:hypothetical protein
MTSRLGVLGVVHDPYRGSRPARPVPDNRYPSVDVKIGDDPARRRAMGRTRAGSHRRRGRPKPMSKSATAWS